MKRYPSKLGFSDIGGICAGRSIQTSFHRHHAVTIILSFGKPFTIVFEDEIPRSFSGILLQKEVSHKFVGSDSDYALFIHFDPYTKYGLRLGSNKNSFQELNIESFLPIIDRLRTHFPGIEHEVETLLHTIFCVATRDSEEVRIDSRVKKAIDLLKKYPLQNVKIEAIASAVGLSSSRFAHLFKQETGTTYRRFVRHLKLVESLRSVCQENRLVDCAFDGNFSDQAHFTRTFRSAFGVVPSLIVQR